MWTEKGQSENPGPGNYSDHSKAIGKTVQGGHMGQKFRSKTSMSPGPGAYESEDKLMKVQSSVRIG